MNGIWWILAVFVANAILAGIAKRAKAKAEADALLRTGDAKAPPRVPVSVQKHHKHGNHQGQTQKGAMTAQGKAKAQPPRIPAQTRAPSSIPQAPTSDPKAYSIGTAAEAMADHKSAFRAHAASDLARLKRQARSPVAMREFMAMSEVLGGCRAVAPWHPVG